MCPARLVRIKIYSNYLLSDIPPLVAQLSHNCALEQSDSKRKRRIEIPFQQTENHYKNHQN